MTAQIPALTGYTLAELRALEFPAHSWIIEGLIPAGSLTLLVGRPKAGKSLLAIDLLASVATGADFLGRPVEAGKAVYLPAEDSPALVRERLEARLGQGDAPDLIVCPCDGSLDQWLRLDDPASFTALARTIGRYAPAVLALDPLRELHYQPENDADAMAAMLRPLRQLAHQTNCAIVIVHHRNKHGADPSLAARGSSAIVGSVDQTITLDQVDGEEPDDGEVTRLSVLVEGRFGPRQRWRLQLGDGLRWQVSGERAADTRASERILALLSEREAGMTVPALANALGLAPRTAREHLAALVSAGEVERRGEGHRHDPYVYGRANAPWPAAQRALPPLADAEGEGE